jgi:hypothetical protein
MLSAPSLISVKEARKLLGSQYNFLSNEEVERMVTLMDNIAREFIRNRVP